MVYEENEPALINILVKSFTVVDVDCRGNIFQLGSCSGSFPSIAMLGMTMMGKKRRFDLIQVQKQVQEMICFIYHSIHSYI
jgi:hypothetical protein